MTNKIGNHARTALSNLDIAGDLSVGGDAAVDGEVAAFSLTVEDIAEVAHVDIDHNLTVGGNAEITGDVRLTSIVSSDNADVVVEPDGVGLIKLGSSDDPWRPAASKSVYIDRDLLIEGNMFFHSDANCYGKFNFVGSEDTGVEYNVANQRIALNLGNTSKSLLLIPWASRATNFGHGNQPNTTLIVQDAGVSNNVKISHNNSDAYIRAGSGSFVHNHEAPVDLADDGTFSLPDASCGYGTFMVGDNEEYAQIRWTTAGAITLVTNSVNVATADTDGSLCFIDSGTQVQVKNRLGASKKIVFDYHYTI